MQRNDRDKESIMKLKQEGIWPVYRTYEKRVHQTFSLHIDELVDMVSDKEPKVVVDAGCAKGCTTKELSDLFPHHTVLGYDISEDILKAARAEHSGPNIEYREGNVLDLDLDDASVNAVVAMNSIGSWTFLDPPSRGRNERFVKEAARVLVPGGVLAVSVNDSYFMAVRDAEGSFECFASSPEFGKPESSGNYLAQWNSLVKKRWSLDDLLLSDYKDFRKGTTEHLLCKDVNRFVRLLNSARVCYEVAEHGLEAVDLFGIHENIGYFVDPKKAMESVPDLVPCYAWQKSPLIVGYDHAKLSHPELDESYKKFAKSLMIHTDEPDNFWFLDPSEILTFFSQEVLKTASYQALIESKVRGAEALDENNDPGYRLYCTRFKEEVKPLVDSIAQKYSEQMP